MKADTGQTGPSETMQQIGAAQLRPFACYTACRDSGIEWLGWVPAHWDLPPLYARYRVELGKMLDAKRIMGEHLLPYLRNVDVQWDRVNAEGLPEMDIRPEEKARFTLLPGDLVVCEGGEVGRTATWRGEVTECAYQKAIHRLRPCSERDSPRFLYYVMRAAAGVRQVRTGAEVPRWLHRERLWDDVWGRTQGLSPLQPPWSLVEKAAARPALIPHPLGGDWQRVRRFVRTS